MRIKQTRSAPQDGTVLLDFGSVTEYQKMNFSPFTTQFAGLPANAVNQFTTAKFAQNLTTANGQVVGVVSGGEGGVHYLRPVDGGTTTFSGQIQQNNGTQVTTTNMTAEQQTTAAQQSAAQQQQPPQAQALITLPITVPGAKPGDAQQTVHIQVINPNPLPQQQTPKFQMGQMQIPIQSFQPGGTTVLTVAYSPQDGKFIPNHGFPEGMTVVAALQPQDLQLLAQAQVAQAQAEAVQNAAATVQLTNQNLTEQQNGGIGDEKRIGVNNELVSVKQEPDWENTLNLNGTTELSVSEYITHVTQSLPINLQPFLKFNPNNIKCESNVTTINEENTVISSNIGAGTGDGGGTVTTITSGATGNATTSNGGGGGGGGGDDNTKPKRKRKTVKKPPKPKPPKPGQVLIATAIDGTILFCCPECQMAYPEKENLEQHLTVHKIERRYICDICGAGLKRKEHLERHKSGHNPDRPYICSVCMKGFKRKEHLNLHFVIHSGEKNEICGECGKGFYRKDHLRKHVKSHVAKRLKEEMNARIKMENNKSTTTSITDNDDDGGGGGSGSGGNGNTNMTLQPQITIVPQTQQTVINDQQNQQEQINSSGGDHILNTTTNSITQNLPPHTQPAISLSTVYVPTSDNTTLPVQIQIPQIVTTTSADGTTTNTIVMPPTTTVTGTSTMAAGIDSQPMMQEMMATQ